MKKNGFGRRALLTLLLLALTLGAMAQAAGKLVTLKMKAAPVSRVLVEIKRQTGLNFIYNAGLEKNWPKVNIQLKNKPASTAISQVADIIGCTYTINGTVVTLTQQQVGQARRTISGTVRDEEGNPMVGAPVRVSGTQLMTITDADGHYEMSIPQGRCQLKISYVGMDDQIVLVSAGKLPLKKDITLTDANNLSEVVVTGYQTISKERTTGAFDKVTSKDLAARPTADLSSALQGMVAGMQATEAEDGTATFTIRGQSTLYANAQPLIVVDGFPIDGSFETINPNDVESVTVLKDAAAASIWGTRSANGVIVVTTKKGRSKQLTVEGKAMWRINTNSDLDYILNQADSRTTIDYELRAIQNGWDMGNGYSPSLSNLYGSPLSLAQEYYYDNKYNGLSEADMNAGLEMLRQRSNRQQLKDYLMQTAVLRQYNVSAQGGNDRMDNYISLQYEKNDERTIRRGYDKYMLNYNNQFRFNKHITATASATLQKRSRDFSGVTLQEFAKLSPYEMVLNDDGSYADELNTWNRLEMRNVDMTQFPYSDVSYNMLREVRNRNYKEETTDYRIQLGLTAKIIKGLSYDIKYQYERNDTKTHRYDNEETFYVRNTVDFYNDFDTATGKVGKSYIPTGGIKRDAHAYTFNDVLRNQVNYSDVFGKHDVTAIAGIEISRYVSRSTTYPTVYGFNEKTNTAPQPYYGQQDNVGNMFGYSYYSSSLFSSLATTYYDREDRYVSYYGNASYVYDGRYGASFSIRSDGSNFISKDSSLRWSPMWSAGLKWNIDREAFMKTVGWVDRLTLRGTYGSNGNAEKSTSPETLVSTYTTSSIHGQFTSIASYGNPLLKWEKTKTFNLGVDFSLLHNALSGKIDYYNRYSKDIVGDVTIPNVYGTNRSRFNNAEISNRGVEVQLTGRYTVKPIGLGIQSTVLFSYNKNKIEKLYNPSLYCYQLVEPTTFVEGKPIGSFYSYEFAGTKDGVPYVKGIDGEPSSMNDLTLHNRTIGLDILKYEGTTIAPYTLGWNWQFAWNGLQLSIYMTGKFGAVFRCPAYAPPVVSGNKVFVSRDITRYGESDGTTYPTWPKVNETWMYRWDRYIPNLSSLVESADFIKLKEMDLSWTIPQQWLSRVNIKGASIFAQARNLGMLWKANKYGYDPEWLPGTNKPATSISFGATIDL